MKNIKAKVKTFIAVYKGVLWHYKNEMEREQISKGNPKPNVLLSHMIFAVMVRNPLHHDFFYHYQKLIEYYHTVNKKYIDKLRREEQLQLEFLVHNYHQYKQRISLNDFHASEHKNLYAVWNPGVDFVQHTKHFYENAPSFFKDN